MEKWLPFKNPNKSPEKKFLITVSNLHRLVRPATMGFPRAAKCCNAGLMMTLMVLGIPATHWPIAGSACERIFYSRLNTMCFIHKFILRGKRASRGCFAKFSLVKHLSSWHYQTSGIFAEILNCSSVLHAAYILSQQSPKQCKLDLEQFKEICSAI